MMRVTDDDDDDDDGNGIKDLAELCFLRFFSSSSSSSSSQCRKEIGLVSLHAIGLPSHSLICSFDMYLAAFQASLIRLRREKFQIEMRTTRADLFSSEPRRSIHSSRRDAHQLAMIIAVAATDGPNLFRGVLLQNGNVASVVRDFLHGEAIEKLARSLA